MTLKKFLAPVFCVFGRLSRIAVFAILISAPAIADNVHFLGANLDRYELGNEAPYEWKLVGKGPATPQYFDPQGNTTSTGYTVRFEENNLIKFGDDHRNMEDADLGAPAPGVTYKRAHVDGNENLWVELGGQGHGFEFFSGEDQKIIKAGQIHWADGSRGPDIKRLVADPAGSNVYALLGDGSVEKITAPFNAAGTFGREKVLPAGSARDLVSAWEGVLIDQGAGQFSLIKKDEKMVSLPKLPVDGRAFSEFDHGFNDEMFSYAAEHGYRPVPAGPAAGAVHTVTTHEIQTSAKEVSFARTQPAKIKEFTAAELTQQIAARRSRVPELEFIRKEAKKLGVRVWLFGGTASGFAHYVNWDMQREFGDTRFQPDRFDYDYTNIYRSTQDLDIVMDGKPDAAAALQNALGEAFPHFQGSKTAWEVRLLKGEIGDKEALLNNPNYLNQHTDSNSTGLIEVTDPPHGESVVRDLRDWNSKEPYFLRDVHEHRLHYYFSPSHFTTKRAAEGKNPEILSVIRYLTKAFQYDLELRPEDVKQMQKIIAEFHPGTPQDYYVQNWIEKNGKKLLQNAVNIEYAWKKLRELGLAQKLGAIQGNPGEVDSLAWWMNKQPLLSLPVGKGDGLTAAQIFARDGLPNDAQGRLVVAHEPRTYLAYESITRAHTGEPNVLTSRKDNPGEAAAYGDGFYTRAGREGAAGSGLHIRFALDPMAREGTDFIYVPDAHYFVLQNKSAFRVLPESLNMTLKAFFETLTQDDSLFTHDKGVLEKMRRQVLGRAALADQNEVREVAEIVKKHLDGETKDLTVLTEWLRIPAATRGNLDDAIMASAAEVVKKTAAGDEYNAIKFLTTWLSIPETVRAKWDHAVGTAAAKNPAISFDLIKLADANNAWSDVPEIMAARERFSRWMIPYRALTTILEARKKDAQAKSLATGQYHFPPTEDLEKKYLEASQQLVRENLSDPGKITEALNFIHHFTDSSSDWFFDKTSVAKAALEVIPLHGPQPPALFSFMFELGTTRARYSYFDDDVEKELLRRFFRPGTEVSTEALKSYLDMANEGGRRIMISDWDRYGKYVEKDMIGPSLGGSVTDTVDALFTEAYRTADHSSVDNQFRIFLQSYRKNILDAAVEHRPQYKIKTLDQDLYKRLKNWRKYKDLSEGERFDVDSLAKILDEELLGPEADKFPLSRSYLHRIISPSLAQPRRIPRGAALIAEEEPIQHGRHTWADPNTPEWHIPQSLPESSAVLEAEELPHLKIGKFNCSAAFKLLPRWWKTGY